MSGLKKRSRGATVGVAPAETRRIGRPRNEETRKVILATTLKLLESETLQSISIEGIAREAGVSKATIYRWWSSKASIVLDAFMEHHLVRTPMRHDLPPAEALVDHIAALIDSYSGWAGRIVAQIIAEGQSDAALLREFRERFQYGRRAAVREVLESWRQQGGIPAHVDLELLTEVLYGPIYARLLLGSAALHRDFADQLASLVFSMFGLDNASGRRP
ncbi:TetR/AcrR family transcriptional regulator [Sphingobium sp.]|uniref:TetR/AcrR family transcriptional regulator n=1 Tax=Sphingobium sp. TaxID=1912891 RepID=UPI0028BD1D56|nr:TetR/AcrR family transcriptional regulator [Sphingobium sp.]